MTEPVAAGDSQIYALNRGGSFNRPRDWIAFEHLARDLFIRLLGDPFVDLNGRSGQAQAGVDVFGVNQQTGERVGVQCKGRADAVFTPAAGLTEAEFRAEVARARTFKPPIKRFVMLTTGPNDTNLKRVAAELSEEHAAHGLFQVTFHGWDWIEGLLDYNVDLAVRYGLVAVVHALPIAVAPESPIAVKIGARLRHAIDLINTRRNGDDRVTVQGLASLAGYPSWRRLEQILAGNGDVDEAELERLSETFGMSPAWIVEGKGAPFRVDSDAYPGTVEAICETIMEMEPRRILFVRQGEGAEGHHSACIVLELDDLRWHVLRNPFPICDRVGGGGSRDMFDMCRLMRHLNQEEADRRIPINSLHLDAMRFWELMEGEVYPGALLDIYHFDGWWEGFSEFRLDWLTGEAPHWHALREAVGIVRGQLARARENAATSRYWREALGWGKFRLKAPPRKDEGEPWP